MTTETVSRSHIGDIPLTEYGGFLIGFPVYSILDQWHQGGGRQVRLSSGYRTHGQQADLHGRKPGLAVAPGHSYHERGLAIDVDFSGWSSSEQSAFVSYMKSRGFAWGGDFDRVKEPWHFGLGEGGAEVDLSAEPELDISGHVNQMRSDLVEHLGFDPYADLPDPLAELKELDPTIDLLVDDIIETPPATEGVPNPYSREAAMAAQAAGVPVEWATDPDLVELIAHESSWNPQADNPTSTAYGLGQFLRSTWEHYLPEVPYGTNDPYWQMVGVFRYIKQRYGTPADAWGFWQRMRWY